MDCHDASVTKDQPTLRNFREELGLLYPQFDAIHFVLRTASLNNLQNKIPGSDRLRSNVYMSYICMVVYMYGRGCFTGSASCCFGDHSMRITFSVPTCPENFLYCKTLCVNTPEYLTL
jgi:hypothetical protein